MIYPSDGHTDMMNAIDFCTLCLKKLYTRKVVVYRDKPYRYNNFSKFVHYQVIEIPLLTSTVRLLFTEVQIKTSFVYVYYLIMLL